MNHATLSEEEVFQVAREISSPNARSVYLKQACGQNSQLFERVVALLRATEEEESFLESPPVGLVGTIAAMPCQKPGDSIGPYKLLQKIGEGGFGVVYMAEQTEPIRRKVALKIIKPGMDTKDVVARFEVERQALALMDHPSIAKVLDGGATESGHPYFVMELVKGIPLTQFCDENKLDVRQRLNLFCTVCKAIQHSHHKGVIHRDIKPSNVLVTLHDGEPVPKVIDFGVSKAISQQLTEKTMFTAYGQMIGTPQYMSPEQAEMSGLDIDTRSDVYSLGVLLYELLTGSTPLDPTKLKQTAYAELQRMIREVEPPKPSVRLSTLGEQSTSVAAHRNSEPKKLGAFVRGELDWIVMKSLEKNRDRRYETANSMAMDVESFLNGEPVKACPPSLTYQCRKFVRRHAAVLATTGAIVVVLLVATLVSSVAAIQARHALRKAKEELAMRLAADERFNKTKGEQAIQNALLDALSGHYDQVESHLRDAAVYKVDPGRISLLQGWTAINREEYRDAHKHLESAMTQLPGSVGPKALLAQQLLYTGDFERFFQLRRECEDLAPRTLEDYLFAGYILAYIDNTKAISLLEELLTERKSPAVFYMLGRAYELKAQRTYDLGDMDRMIEYVNLARTSMPSDLIVARRHAFAHLIAADYYRLKGQVTLANHYFKKARETAHSMLDAFPESSYSHQANAAVAMYEGEVEGAIEHARLANQYAQNLDHRSDLATLLRLVDRPEEALEVHDHDTELQPYLGLAKSYLIAEIAGVRAAETAYEDWLHSIKRPLGFDIERVFRLFCYLGKPEQAIERSRAYRKRCEPFRATNQFSKAIRDFTCGDISEQDLLDAATSRQHRIKAHELLAFVRLGHGNRAAAIRHFELAAREGAPIWGTALNLHGKAATVYLTKLQRDPTWPEWIPVREVGKLSD